MPNNSGHFPAGGYTGSYWGAYYNYSVQNNISPHRQVFGNWGAIGNTFYDNGNFICGDALGWFIKVGTEPNHEWVEIVQSSGGSDCNDSWDSHSHLYFGRGKNGTEIRIHNTGAPVEIWNGNPLG